MFIIFWSSRIFSHCSSPSFCQVVLRKGAAVSTIELDTEKDDLTKAVIRSKDLQTRVGLENLERNAQLPLSFFFSLYDLMVLF